MKKIIAIIAGEPNSIASEIIFKTWKLKKKNYNRFFVIGNIDILKKQKKKLKFLFKIKKIDENFTYTDLIGNSLPVYNINYHQKRAFEKISSKSNKYIFQCFDHAIKFIKKNKINGFINCPISKKYLLKNKYQGITEFLSKKSNVYGDSVMLIYNKKLSVSPITTHVPLRKVSKKLNASLIVKKIQIISNFYKKNFNKKPTIGVLGLNPHNHSAEKKSEETKIIIPALKILKKKNIRVKGPISPDTSFLTYKKHKLNVIVGMYHDQVLSPFKTLFGYNAINITLGLPYIRMSPDHGIGEDIVGKGVSNPESLLESIKFFSQIK